MDGGGGWRGTLRVSEPEPRSEIATGIAMAAATVTAIAARAPGPGRDGGGACMPRRIFSRRWATLSSTSVTAWQWLHRYSLVSSLVNWALPQVEQVRVTVLIVVCRGVIGAGRGAAGGRAARIAGRRRGRGAERIHL